MGIKYFYSWLKREHSECIKSFEYSVPGDKPLVDVLLLDLNGIIHGCAQKIFEYGVYKPFPTVLSKKREEPYLQKVQRCYEEIANYVMKIVLETEPRKEIVICIDGPAPLSKINQQRQRRFRSSEGEVRGRPGETSLCREATRVSAEGGASRPRALRSEGPPDDSFDKNSITPGTKFMHHLSRHIDFFLRKTITYDPRLQNLKIFFSDEKCPGEGEHKLMAYIRKFGNHNDSFCIVGMDADFIMLGLASKYPNFFVFREPMAYSRTYSIIDLKIFSESLKINVNDFILMCFLVGNDFLPSIPLLEINRCAITIFLEEYSKTKDLTTIDRNGKIVINVDRFLDFVGILAKREEELFGERKKMNEEYIPDPLFDESPSLEIYKEKYYKAHSLCPEELSKAFLHGMEWVLSYYTSGVPNWRWVFPYLYGPFISDVALVKKGCRTEIGRLNEPIMPFLQLLCVLPPQSSSLLPSPLETCMKDRRTKFLYPLEFEVDSSGKKNDWEAIVKIPLIDIKKVEKVYHELIEKVDEREKDRNVRKGWRRYDYRPDHSYVFKISNDKIEHECKTVVVPFDL